MHSNRQGSSLPLVQRVSAVVWPAFLCAGAATGVFFTVFDPVVLLEIRHGWSSLRVDASVSFDFRLILTIGGCAGRHMGQNDVFLR